MSAMVILPCAGAGSRLGLPYPKELLAVGPNRLLIDDTVDLLRTTSAPLGGVVIVVDDHHRPTIPYVTARLGDLPVCVVRQPPPHVAWTGAVHSARPWLADRALVLLPDQIVRAADGTDPLAWALSVLTRHRISFLAHQPAHPDCLAGDGALKVARDSDPSVTDYLEKPGPAAARFDSAWVALAFRVPEGLPAVQAMHRMLTTPASPVAPVTLGEVGILGAPVGWVASYHDLGCWPAVTRHWHAQQPPSRRPPEPL